MVNHDELSVDELEALTRTATSRRNWIGEEVCTECFDSHNMCFGYHRRGRCAKCGKEAMIYEILP